MLDWVSIYLSQKPKLDQDNNPTGTYDIEEAVRSLLKSLGGAMKNVPLMGQVKRHKSNLKSTELRDLADKFAINIDCKGLDRALQLYTESIAYALDDQQLALGYASRSRVLFKINRFEECLEDIERALQLQNSSAAVKLELLQDRGNCTSKLAVQSLGDSMTWMGVSGPLGKDSLQVLDKHSSVDKIKAKVVLDEECLLPEIKSPSERYHCASDAVEIKYSEFFGRHVVATRDIEPGEVLVVEEPHSRFLEDDNIYSHCSYCMRYLWTGIACGGCVNAVYCSEDCKAKAWNEYHEVECPLLNAMLDLKAMRSEMFSVRLLVEGIVEAGGLQELKKRLMDLEQLKSTKEWQNSDRWIQDKSLERIFSLEVDEANIPREVYWERVVYATRAVLLLAVTTKIFGLQYDRREMTDDAIALALSENPDAKLVGKLLVKLSLVMLTKFHTFREDCFGNERCRGHVAMPFLSCFNHSCLSNVNRQNKRNHVVVYAALPIRKGEQVFDSYGETCMQNGRPERQANLLKNYYFTCTCKPCQEKWPIHPFMRSYESLLKSSRSRQTVARAVSQHPMFHSKIARKDFAQKDKLMKELNGSLKMILDSVHMPCRNVIDFMIMISEVYFLTGNISRMHYMRA